MPCFNIKKNNNKMEPQEDGFSFYPIEIVSNDLNHYFEDDSDEEEEGKIKT